MECPNPTDHQQLPCLRKIYAYIYIYEKFGGEGGGGGVASRVKLSRISPVRNKTTSPNKNEHSLYNPTAQTAGYIWGFHAQGPLNSPRYAHNGPLCLVSYTDMVVSQKRDPKEPPKYYSPSYWGPPKKCSKFWETPSPETRTLNP